MIALVFIGQPGSGKSTVAKLVAESLQLDLISSGDIARHIGESDQHARDILIRGEQAPESAIRIEVQARIEAAAVTTGDFVIEGFPRRLEQLYILESIPDVQTMYLVIDCDPLVCLRRLIARRREGEHPDAVGMRFRFHQEYTEPMIACVYRHSYLLDGNQDPQTLADEVCHLYHLRQDQ